MVEDVLEGGGRLFFVGVQDLLLMETEVSIPTEESQLFLVGHKLPWNFPGIMLKIY